MKPESVKSILRSYLRERQHSSSYNDFHGFSSAPSKHRLVAQGLTLESGKPFHCAGKIVDDLEVFAPQSAGLLQDERNDLVVMQFQSADLPWDEHNVPLEPQLDELAIGVGRRLSQMSDEFDLNLIVPLNNLASSSGNGCIQFKERIIRVPATCDHVQIPIIRTRAEDSVVNATWRTCDKSAKAGLHYVNSEGNISFGQGDEEKTIEVEIIRDQERRTDIHFAVELFDSEGTFNTLTVYIIDDSRLYPEEKQCIKNIFSCARNSSISEIVTCLRDKVTHNTFKAALQCLCSNADTIPKELALGAELLRLTMPHAPLSTLTNVLCGYFSYLPELEDIAHLF
ncbi:hypothetical protein AVEN_236669-1 [Araneus ventricosus]|uniref:Calx-beta domain-containing protein n=1 Tax=Araneus ventricosus TaxID=182803 RepID=A0A4Y2LEX9_ARAVE|nr:hypothetical protein AVEN_236669-1 [Araneus ventricosus]